MVKEKITKQVFPMMFFVLLILYTISLVVPAIWVFLTAMKSQIEFISDPFGLPPHWRLANFIKVFSELKRPITDEFGVSHDILLPRLFLNSFLYSLSGTIITTFVQCITAYVVAKYNFKFGRLIYAVVIVTMIMPIVGNLASSITVMTAIHFYDNFFGVLIMKASFLGTNFLIFYATFKGISWEYAEAAFIDGASHARVMFTIMIPLARTTVLALGLISFIGFWNDWQINMIYLPSFPVVAYALYTFQFNVTNGVSGTPYLMAACLWVLLPILVLFIIFRNKLMGAIAVGGLKG